MVHLVIGLLFSSCGLADYVDWPSFASSCSAFVGRLILESVPPADPDETEEE